MQLVVNNTTHVVTYSGDGFSFVPYLVCSTFMDNGCTAATHTIDEVTILPQPWADGAYTYISGIFALINPTAIPVPSQVSMRQARLALLAGGYLTTVNTAINVMGGPAGQAAQVTWEYASFISRTDPLVAQMQVLLGLTSAQIDQLFITAISL